MNRSVNGLVGTREEEREVKRRSFLARERINESLRRSYQSDGKSNLSNVKGKSKAFSV